MGNRKAQGRGRRITVGLQNYVFAYRLEVGPAETERIEQDQEIGREAEE